MASGSIKKCNALGANVISAAMSGATIGAGAYHDFVYTFNSPVAYMGYQAYGIATKNIIATAAGLTNDGNGLVRLKNNESSSVTTGQVVIYYRVIE